MDDTLFPDLEASLAITDEVDTIPADFVLTKFINVFPGDGSLWRVATGKRFNQVGALAVNLSLKHSTGHEIVLRFPDGKLEAHNPFHLFPERPGT